MEEKLIITSLFLSNGVQDKHGLNAYLKQLYPKDVQGKYYWADDKNPLIMPNDRIFKGQLYLLVDQRVASAASHLASLIKSYTNAVVIGKETVGGYYEHNGHLPLVYELPNTGIQTGFSIVHVIDPHAPVTILLPRHPLLTGPNIIGPADWDGWDKERGLYFASDFDDAYEPLLSMHDANEQPLNGGLISARIGKGRHTHTGLVLHHQLDRLVPGAFRLMANLVQPA